MTNKDTAPDRDSAAPRPRRLLGQILVEEGLITRHQLEAALRVQAERASGTPIGQLLVEQAALRQDQLDAVLDKYRLGHFLVETNAISRDQLEIALRQQRVAGRRLGEVLLQLRYLTEIQLRRALAKHLGSKNFIEPRYDKNGSMQVRFTMALDATRVENSRVVKVDIDEAAWPLRRHKPGARQGWRCGGPCWRRPARPSPAGSRRAGSRRPGGT